MNRFVVAYKALDELGFQPLALNLLYKLGLASGHYRRATSRPPQTPVGQLRSILPLPARSDLLSLLGDTGQAALLAEADEIAAGSVRLFGAEPCPLHLSLPAPLAHWTAYETGRVPLPLQDLPYPDIKFLWEPARFGWVFPLARAYHLTGDEKYAGFFWQAFETFSDANPPYQGPHWMSAQEAALRLMAFVWADALFAASPASTPSRRARLAESVAAHAARIPPTLVYARSQQNNHLLTEAAALFTAGLALPDAPDAARWRDLGWRWLNAGLQAQIDPYGEYAQHSTNYHRLMLQVVLWVHALLEPAGLHWQYATREAVGRAVHWYLALLDVESGAVPNLGANDGALLFQLSIQPFSDHRPVAHAAARAFLNYELPGGPWDEMALWFAALHPAPHSMQLPRYIGDHIYAAHSWAYLRTAQYATRPSHADQLHLDLWWRGLNIARDAGTFLYNAPPPWDNQLTTALLHNTVTLNGRDQMSRVGRFLYLDWVDAYRRDEIASEEDILLRMRGVVRCSRRGYRHTRALQVSRGDRWVVRDEILPLRLFKLPKEPFRLRIHWLLPDWQWELGPLPPDCSGSGSDLRLLSPHGWMTVRLQAEHAPAGTAGVHLVRAGQSLFGQAQPMPQQGWFSPTYGLRLPALSLTLQTDSPENTGFITEFIFPGKE